MGLFDSIAGSMMGKLAGGSNANPMLQAGLDLINQYGGAEGVLNKLRESGLGDEVSSWLGQGANLPISLQQILQVFGQEAIKSMAHKFDLPADEFGSKLAEYLPKVIDKLSPDGKVPTSQVELMARAFSLLK
ncbi:YidB family protein [Methylobacillus gramineus]|uniref:YidB family protein n=1 Tax=Methylobacillus gramineus TaxID=755169 RepID=UPI001CFF68D9|nr:YidB family protein [Methylobacillus gramineus]MCB5185916.1 YidB family protein [Methylobacillus gramineus]